MDDRAPRRRSQKVWLVLAVWLLLAAPAPAAPPAEPVPADAAIARAIAARLGAGAVVSIASIDVPDAAAGDVFVDARVDPAARLGGPIRVRLVRARGTAVTAVATVRVEVEHVVAARDLRRGETVGPGDVTVAGGELRDVPVRRMPTAAEIAGRRVLRPVAAGHVVLPGAVAVRRAVEPGDRVTAVAEAGDVAVTATLTATDGGDPGDVIRVVNMETRRSLRGRITGTGQVEVGYAR